MPACHSLHPLSFNPSDTRKISDVIVRALTFHRPPAMLTVPPLESALLLADAFSRMNVR